MKCSLCDSDDVVFTRTFEGVCVAYCQKHYEENSDGGFVSVEVPFFPDLPQEDGAT
jgi:hypothetical protein